MVYSPCRTGMWNNEIEDTIVAIIFVHIVYLSVSVFSEGNYTAA